MCRDMSSRAATLAGTGSEPTVTVRCSHASVVDAWEQEREAGRDRADPASPRKARPCLTAGGGDRAGLPGRHRDELPAARPADRVNLSTRPRNRPITANQKDRGRPCPMWTIWPTTAGGHATRDLGDPGAAVTRAIEYSLAGLDPAERAHVAEHRPGHGLRLPWLRLAGPGPGHRHMNEYCENGATRINDGATTRRATAEFFVSRRRPAGRSSAAAGSRHAGTLFGGRRTPDRTSAPSANAATRFFLRCDVSQQQTTTERLPTEARPSSEP
jgi:hypothetical protein